MKYFHKTVLYVINTIVMCHIHYFFFHNLSLASLIHLYLVTSSIQDASINIGQLQTQTIDKSLTNFGLRRRFRPSVAPTTSFRPE